MAGFSFYAAQEALLHHFRLCPTCVREMAVLYQMFFSCLMTFSL